MRVLMYGWEFPPQISGGLGMACFGIVNELLKLHVSVSFVLPRAFKVTIQNHLFSVIDCARVWQETNTHFTEKLNHWLTRYPIDSLLHAYCTPTSYLDLLGQEIAVSSRETSKTVPGAVIKGGYGPDLFSEVLRYAAVAGYLAKTVPHDVIHVHDWLTILAGIEAKRASRKPLIFQIHALETDRTGKLVNRRIFDIEQWGMQQADSIIAVSQFTKNQIVEHYGIDPNKITVIHNGIYVDPSAHSISSIHPSSPVVLFVGRITHQKGPYFFIEIAKKVLSKRPDTQFVIVGTGDQLVDMIEKTAVLRIGQNVHFTGFLHPNMVNRLYQLADVYVMPSVSEPFGLSCLEALTHQVPVLISKQSGVSEVLPHVLKADFWDIDEMAAKILAVLAYPALKKEMLKHCEENLRELTWENTAKKIQELYGTLCPGAQ